MFSFQLDDELKAMQTMVRKFTKDEIIPQSAHYDEISEFPWPIVKKAHGLGLWDLSLPVEYGGVGLDTFAQAVLAEELSYGCLGIANAFTVNCLALTPILMVGTEEQKDRWLPKFSEKALVGAMCMTESNAGSDLSTLSTSAVKDRNDYILNGTKTFISHGGIADMYTVLAKTDKTKGPKGISAFLVPGNAPGLSMGKKENTLGVRAHHVAEVIFDNVRVPANDMLGKEGQGFMVAMQTLDRTRTTIGACAVGLARRALEESIKYAGIRVQFGKPIGQHQGISWMLADMATKIEAARSLVWYAASEVDTGKKGSMLGAMSKVFAGDMAMEVALNAVQIHGGYGYMKDYPIEKLMRDAKILQIYEGTQQINRMVIAGNLLRA